MDRQRQQNERGSGFLITCDKNKEKQAIKDAYNFIDEYIQQIYGDIQADIIHKQLDKQGKEHNLQNQIQARNQLKSKLRILSSVQTNVNILIKCVVFIKINEKANNVIIDPIKIVAAMMKDIHSEGRELTRFCHKILPVQRSFKAQHFKMLDQIDLLFQKRDNSQIKSWALNFKCRNNSKFNYKEVLKETEKIAKKYGHFVDIYYPQWTVSVQIVHHLMCLSISEGFKQYQQFRLHKKGNKINNNLESKADIMYEKKKEKQKNNKRRQNEQSQQKQKQKQQLMNADSKQQKQDDSKINKQQIQKEKNIKETEQRVEKQKVMSALLEQKIAPQNDDDIDFI